MKKKEPWARFKPTRKYGKVIEFYSPVKPQVNDTVVEIKGCRYVLTEILGPPFQSSDPSKPLLVFWCKYQPENSAGASSQETQPTPPQGYFRHAAKRVILKDPDASFEDVKGVVFEWLRNENGRYNLAEIEAGLRTAYEEVKPDGGKDVLH